MATKRVSRRVPWHNAMITHTYVYRPTHIQQLSVTTRLTTHSLFINCTLTRVPAVWEGFLRVRVGDGENNVTRVALYSLNAMFLAVLTVQKNIARKRRQSARKNCKQKPSLLWTVDWDHGQYSDTMTDTHYTLTWSKILSSPRQNFFSICIQSINQFNSNLAARESDSKWYAVEIIDKNSIRLRNEQCAYMYIGAGSSGGFRGAGVGHAPPPSPTLKNSPSCLL